MTKPIMINPMRKASLRADTKDLLALSLLTAVGLQSVALAGDSPDDRNFDRRVYVGAGIGDSHVEPDPGFIGNRVTDSRDSSKSLYLGYDLSKHWSVEAYATDMGEAQMIVNAFRPDGTPYRQEGAIGYRDFGVSAVGYFFNSRSATDYSDGFDDEGYFRREGLSLFGKVGVGTMRNYSDDIDYRQRNEAHLMLGAGLEYGWSNGIAVRAEYTAYDEDSRFVGLALLKRFGKANPYPVAVVVPPEPPVVPAPEPAPVPLALPKVHFEFDRADLSAEERAKLDALSTDLQPRPDVRLEIQGHTDSKGSVRYNQGLSERRAESVRQYLESRGVNTGRFEVRGYSELQPVDTNETKAGRANNRRVDIIEIE